MLLRRRFLGVRTSPSSLAMQTRDSEGCLLPGVSRQIGGKLARGESVHVIVEPLTNPPTHSKSVHTAPPFIPTSAVEFDDDELLVALGLALEPVAVAVDARLELDESSPCPPSSPWWYAHVKSRLNGDHSEAHPPNQIRIVASPLLL